MGWDELGNGRLLQVAGRAGFDAILSIDKKLEHEQNLTKLPCAIILVDAQSKAFQLLVEFVPHIIKLLEKPLKVKLHILQSNGLVIRLDAPRR